MTKPSSITPPIPPLRPPAGAPPGLGKTPPMRKVAFLVLALLVIGAAVVMVVLRKKGVILDSSKVEALAAQMLPGARPPAGLKGVLGLQLPDLQVAIFAPSLPKAEVSRLSADELRIIMAQPSNDQPPQPQVILEKIRQAQEQKSEEMETLERHPILLQIGGKPHPALESTTLLKSNGSRMRENSTLVLVEKRPVILLFCGPEASFNSTLRDQFLAGLNVTAAAPSDLPTPRLAHPPAGLRPSPPVLPPGPPLP